MQQHALAAACPCALVHIHTCWKLLQVLCHAALPMCCTKSFPADVTPGRMLDGSVCSRPLLLHLHHVLLFHLHTTHGGKQHCTTTYYGQQLHTSWALGAAAKAHAAAQALRGTSTCSCHVMRVCGGMHVCTVDAALFDLLHCLALCLFESGN